MNRHERRKLEAVERAARRGDALPIRCRTFSVDDRYPEDFDAFFDGYRDGARGAFDDGNPPLLIHAYAGREAYELIPMLAHPDGRAALPHAVRRVFAEVKAKPTRIISVMEGWMAPPSAAHRPSAHPERIEALIIGAADISGRRRCGWYLIERNTNGSPRLGEWAEDDQADSWLLDLLQPEAHPTVQ